LVAKKGAGTYLRSGAGSTASIVQKQMKEAAAIATSAQPLIYSLCQTYEA
jgi:hypothetical protein